MLPAHLADLPGGSGWNPDLKASRAFCSAPSALISFPDLRNALFVETDFDVVAEKFFGEFWRQFQHRGTCAGQAGKSGMDYRAAMKWVFNPRHAKRKRHSVAGTYAAGRVEATDNVGSWDGCAVSWIVAGLLNVGALYRSDLQLPEHHDRNYCYARTLEPDEDLAVKWAASRNGVPAEYEILMADRKIDAAPPVSNLEELALCMVNGVPVETGSFHIPTGAVDKYGTGYTERSKGGHATLFGGIRAEPGQPALSSSTPEKYWQFKYINSWGFDWALDGALWLPRDHAQAILDDDDSFAII